MSTCEIHIPISPTPDFLRRVHYLAASIELFGGLEPGSYRIVVTVGDAQTVDLADRCPWSRLYPLEWRWVPADLFAQRSYWATAYLRYCYPYAADVVVDLDGDVLVVGPLAEAVQAAKAEQVFQAVPGQFSPFFLFPEHLKTRGPHAWWREFFSAAGLGEPDFTMEHPGWPWMRDRRLPFTEELQFSPPYPNAGVVIAPAAAMSRIGERIFADLDLVRSRSDTVLGGQIALALAIRRLGLAWRPLSLDYNFQNVAGFFDAFPEAAARIRVLHYLHGAEIDRVRDFQTYAQVEATIARRDLSPVNRLLADRLGEVHARKIIPDLRRVGAS